METGLGRVLEVRVVVVECSGDWMAWVHSGEDR